MENIQVHIKSIDIDNDRLIVEAILIEAAKKFNLFDNTGTSKVKHTIKSLVEREHYGFGLGARIANNLIIVDFFPRDTTSPIFKLICEFVFDKLVLSFQKNAVQAKVDEFISLY